MITRLILSLKKAAKTSNWIWGSNHPSRVMDSAMLANHTIGGTDYGADIAPPGVGSVKASHRTIGGTEYESGIALNHISPEGKKGFSEGYDSI